MEAALKLPILGILFASLCAPIWGQSFKESAGFSANWLPGKPYDFNAQLGPLLRSSNGQFELYMTGCELGTKGKTGNSVWKFAYRPCEGTKDLETRLELGKNGNLAVVGRTESGSATYWSTEIGSEEVKSIELLDSGALVLLDSQNNVVWQIGEGKPSVVRAELAETKRWDHNYSCIFDAGHYFSYLHIAYVTYFNVSYKYPLFGTLDGCLDSCTKDCSCSAVVYDVPNDSCYQYHDYIPVQKIPFIPVKGSDTITAYIKVQHGYLNNYPNSAPDLGNGFFFVAIAGVFGALLAIV